MGFPLSPAYREATLPQIQPSLLLSNPFLVNSNAHKLGEEVTYCQMLYHLPELLVSGIRARKACRMPWEKGLQPD